ncbi:tRNA-dihydrouridine synthase family protein [Eubacterium ruminantium]|uniref:tRNA-dihydrouridine synthase family protein n=1 Tax=Eubacterium ruminantium TaxID=42322 RepID=UPI00247A815E|nr:tRNA-dihydrouridine synthase family protein [Eubacterium ruminantium]
MMISLAPMEGITTYIYRNAINKYFGGIDKFYTPFLTASHLKGRELRDVNPDNNDPENLIPQLLVNDSDLFITITKQLQNLGYDEVNLNLGCPSGTVTSKGRGSGFLDKTNELKKFLDDIFDRTPISISIKTRIGFEFINEWEDIAEIYKDYPIKELIIHPRVGKELYKGTAHRDIYEQMISYLKGYMPDTLFTYNGDITTIDDPYYKKDSIMIGRGLINDPSLAYKIKTGNDSFPDFKKSFILFHDELLNNYVTEMNYEDQVVKKMKELWVYFSKGLNIDKKLTKEILKSNSLVSYKNTFNIVKQYIR